jgi:hypothetical protein
MEKLMDPFLQLDFAKRAKINTARAGVEET